MAFKSLTPIITTEKMEETLSFYTQILKFHIEDQNKDWGWARLSKDSIEMMISQPNAHLEHQKSTFTGSFYFEIDDVESLWQELRDHVNICYEIETFPWNMREFAIFDPNEYILQFGQNIE